MCIIVDANAAHHMCPTDDAGAAVLKWLLRGSGKLVVSSGVLKELKPTKLFSTISTLEQAGKLVRANDDLCISKRTELEAEGNLISDDPHVVALASISGCALIFTHDQNLHIDLKNRTIVPHACAIYQTIAHKHLLTQCHC